VLAVFLASLVLVQHELHAAPASTPGWHVGWHGTAFVQYARTFGTRGTYQLGSVNRVMAQAGGPAAGGDVRFDFMGSIEPLTLTDRGVPQLLQASFHTSDGTIITDRAHPSPWIMALSASYERALSEDVAVTLYGAAIGEPALGPLVYLHRASAAANPVVPLGHHLQDDTHSSYGVVTAAVRWQHLHIEASAFNERQPEGTDHVFYYEGARLDSYSARATVAAGAGWSLFGTYGYLPAMTQGHAHGAQHRIGTGAILTSPTWLVTFVYGANDPIGGARTRRSVLVEAQRLWHGGHLFFTRAEFVQRTAEELELVGSINEVQDVGAVQLGYGRDVWRGAVTVGVGAHATVQVVTPQLEPFYGARMPLAFGVHSQVSW